MREPVLGELTVHQEGAGHRPQARRGPGGAGAVEEQECAVWEAGVRLTRQQVSST